MFLHLRDILWPLQTLQRPSAAHLSLQKGPSPTQAPTTIPPCLRLRSRRPTPPALLLWAPQTQDNWNTCFQVSPRSYQAGGYPISVETCVTALHFMPFGWGRRGGNNSALRKTLLFVVGYSARTELRSW